MISVKALSSNLSCIHQRFFARIDVLSRGEYRRSMKYLVDPPPVPTVPVLRADNDNPVVFPVHRIYCVGRNYADHVKEMGGDSQKDAPIFFCKPADAVLHCPKSADSSEIQKMSYPLETDNLHHEVELVLAIGKSGTCIPIDQAMKYVVAYGVGLDLTRRDRQAEAKKNGAPWDVAKALDQGAPIGTLVPVKEGQEVPVPAPDARIWCNVNGEIKQDGSLNQMIWTNAEIIHHLSARFQLQPGDLVFTGTPAGVGPVQVGDTVEAGIDGLPSLQLAIAERAD